eukprot:1064823-Amphidinium_carterae.1
MLKVAKAVVTTNTAQSHCGTILTWHGAATGIRKRPTCPAPDILHDNSDAVEVGRVGPVHERLESHQSGHCTAGTQVSSAWQVDSPCESIVQVLLLSTLSVDQVLIKGKDGLLKEDLVHVRVEPCAAPDNLHGNSDTVGVGQVDPVHERREPHQSEHGKVGTEVSVAWQHTVPASGA